MFIDPNSIETVEDVDKLVLPRKGQAYRDQLKELVQDRIDKKNLEDASVTTSDELPGDTSNSSGQNLTAEEETFKKRYGDLRRYNERLRQDKDKEIQALKAQLNESTKANFKLPKSQEEVEAWMKQFPDVAAIVETIAITKANEASTKGSDRIEQLEKEVLQTKIERAEEVMRRLHPDFEQLRENPDLHKWADLQTDQIKSWLYDNPDDPILCSRALDLYKLDRGIAKTPTTQATKVNKDLEASRIVKTSSSVEPSANGLEGAIKESWVAKLSPAQYERFEAKIEKAVRDGKFIYDLSRPR